MSLPSLRRIFKEENVLYIAISIIAILILHNFVVSLYSKSAQNEFNEFQIKQRDALARIEQIGRFVNLIDLGFRGYYLIPEEQFLNPLNIAQTDFPVNMDSLTIVMEDLGYTETDSIGIVKDWVQGYSDLAVQGVNYIKQGNPEMAAVLFRSDPGYDLWVKYDKVQRSMRDHVTSLNAKNLASNKAITQYAFVSQLALVFFGFMTLGFVVFKLYKNEKAIDGLFNRIKESDQKYVYNDGRDRRHERNEQVIERMINNLRSAAEFIRDITKGNLEVEWKGMNKETAELNNETLAGELITMRDQMIRVRVDEGNRMWVSEGISSISEIMRRNQDNLQEMSDKLLAKIVKYTKSNQGGLFFHKEENNENFLEMTSCFAYDKKKFVERKVSSETGLLGQAFLEGEIIVLKEIPGNYIHITSGLGEATPGNLILIPLKFNEQVVGVLELASFNPFTGIHIELLEKTSEIIASAVVNSRNAEKMRQLLDNAQENAEEMRAQEEEMRQNMEELQATQEELARKEKELVAQISELEKKSGRSGTTKAAQKASS